MARNSRLTLLAHGTLLWEIHNEKRVPTEGRPIGSWDDRAMEVVR
jgi:hypothetical protein